MTDNDAATTPEPAPHNREQTEWLNRLTDKDILAAMDDCDAEGLEAFLARGGFGKPQNWTRRPIAPDGESGGELYPAKAIVAAAMAKLPDGPNLTVKAFFGGFGEQKSFTRLRELGFDVVSTSQEAQAASLFTRDTIEGAMAAYDAYRRDGDRAEFFGAFGDPRACWVRSTNPSAQAPYPSKPLVGFILDKTILNGGWTPGSAAARLHNAGYIVVDENDTPLPPPEKYEHLLRDADRIRACARNYFVEPARDAGMREVTIRAADVAKHMGLTEAFPNICSALQGRKFQEMIGAAPPRHTEPNPSSTTEFTYDLSASQIPAPRSEVHAKKALQAMSPTNLILYGPPGTGKTYETAAEAVRLCGEMVPDDRATLMETYENLRTAGRIEFVTYHQSTSYEDFVEGRQPVTGTEAETEDGDGVTQAGFRLETVPGIFRRVARRAGTSRGHPTESDKTSVAGRQVFKMSIGATYDPEQARLFEDAIENGYTYLGFNDIDWSDPKYADRQNVIDACKAADPEAHADANASSGAVQMPYIFRNWVNKGDIIIVSKGNLLFRAIGEFTGDYEFHPRPEGGYAHRRKVRWLWVDRDGVSVDEIYSRKFMMKSIYLLYDNELNIPALERYMNSQKEGPETKPEPFVLIIDEINRANISKVFGELITLLEPDKRLGMANELKVRLPYSREEFGVPANLHILGTMNTADRSIALLDTALRRRFRFREMMPKPEILADAGRRCGLDLPRILRVMNERIEYLYDREHQIGHAYFTGCKTRADVDDAMRHKVIPLLAEYFFEDWSKIAAVLGDLAPGEGAINGGFLRRTVLNAPPGLEDGDALPRFRWEVRSEHDGFDYTRLLST